MRAAALGRADLLRAWAQTDAGADRLAQLCGYQWVPRTLTLTLEPEESGDQAPVSTRQSAPPEAETEQEIKAPLRARLFHAWVEELTPATAPERLQPVSRDELQPVVTAPPSRLPLVRTPRLWPALQRSLSTRVAAGLDVYSLVRRLALAQRVDPLPLRCEALPATPLLVIWDDAERLRPYEQDYVQILRLIEQLRGRQYTLYTRHAGDWSRWDGPLKSIQHRMSAPPKSGGGIVLLLSDLGALAGASGVEQQWQQQLQSWRRQGAQPVAWLPTAPGQVAAALTRLAVAHHLSARDMRPQRQGWRNEAQRARTQAPMLAASERLLTLAACAVHVAPELLRALRLIDPALRAQPAAEGLAWRAVDVGSSLLSRPLQPERAPHYRRRFGELAPGLQRLVIDTIQQQHARHGRSTPALEWLLWSTHAAPDAQSADSHAQVLAARSLLTRLAREGATDVADGDIRAYARDVVHRLSADAEWWRREGELGGALYQLSGNDRLPTGLEASRALNPDQSDAPRVYLAQRGAGLWLLPEHQSVPVGRRFCEPFAASEVLLERLSIDTDVALRVRVRPELLPIELMAELTNVRVHTPDRQIEILEIERPAWAQEFSRDGAGVSLPLPPFGGKRERFSPLRLSESDARQAFFPPNEDVRLRNVYALRKSATAFIGADQRYGYRLDLQLPTSGDPITQRFRWIPPGEFWMGSNDAERARIEDNDAKNWAKHEAPRHRVQLTQGYWLADTPCTQAFWEALMGDNPSMFKGDPQRPVEKVSWEDVQRALAKLNPLLPAGSHADLPTEAEWEYACRAGTDTAFSCGDELRADARIEGGDLIASGDGESGTAPVASHPANPWGLYDMHGNVWEWCRDGMRLYTVSAVDPEGPLGAARSVRGGSWFDDARDCRSACRSALQPGYRSRDLGFRLLLRSTSQVALPAAAPEHAPEARGEARRDAGPTLAERALALVGIKKGRPK